MKDLMKKYLVQPSTWRGLAVLLGALGVGIAPELLEQIGVGVAGVLGVIEVLRSEPRQA